VESSSDSVSKPTGVHYPTLLIDLTEGHVESQPVSAIFSRAQLLRPEQSMFTKRNGERFAAWAGPHPEQALVNALA
jgi:hypothetical protein